MKNRAALFVYLWFNPKMQICIMWEISEMDFSQMSHSLFVGASGKISPRMLLVEEHLRYVLK